MDTHSPTSSQKSKVTLTNWVRLSNAPLLLSRASAVQWNDYVFVLASDGRALFYHSKHNIWSMLPKSPYTSANLAPALTLYKGRILTTSVNGEMSTFDSQLCQWTVVKDLNLFEGSGPRIIASDNNILYSVVDFKTQVQQEYEQIRRSDNFRQVSYKHTECTVFSYDPSSKWEKICEIGSSPLKSAAVVGGTLFVHAGQDMFKLTQPVQPEVAANPKLEINTILPSAQTTTELNFGMQALAVSHTGINAHNIPRNLPPQGQLQSATACASPTYAGSTLHAIKETLFSFGGRDKDNQPTSDVLRYNPDTDTWESAGYMRSARYNVAVAIVQDTIIDVIVLGGSFGSSEHIMTERAVESDSKTTPIRPPWNNMTSIVEKCTVN
ncbi:uncharacterized protein LOC135339578 [Halichondria panicea]|uniref:uncharacterized protein LOC135339578 n=1 Tax=Halichondria panicea TaxID=6063 RepID=UPI00312B9C04